MKNKYLFGYSAPEIRVAGIRKYLFLILLLGLLRPQGTSAQVQRNGLTLHMQDRPLIEVMEFIEHNTEYRFYYNSKLHDLQRRVSIAVENGAIPVVLDKLFAPLGISYRIRQRDIILADPRSAAAARQNPRSVQGSVKDDEGKPLVGVTILLKGTVTGVTSGADGIFRIQVRGEAPVLQFSYIGYQTVEKTVSPGTTHLDVILKSTSLEVNEVVVTALGITRKEKSLGYAVTKINNEDMNNVVTGNWLSGLSGKVAGLNFDQSSAGPGGSIRVTLRGEGSLSSGKNEALFVVDGVPIRSSLTTANSGGTYSNDNAPIDYGNGASDLNADDIESISVLKGPAATALYGSRAANGAVVVTTKNGRKTKGIGVVFSTGVTFEKAGFWPDFQNEYGAGAFNRTGIGDNVTPPEYSYWAVDASHSDTGVAVPRVHSRTAFGAPLDGSLRYMYASKNQETGEFTRLPFVPQDWYKGFFETGVTYTNSISIDGNTGKGTAIRLSVKDQRNDWIVPNTGYNAQNVSLSVQQQMSRFIKLNAKVTYYRKNSDNLPMSGYSTASPLYSLMWWPVSVSAADMKREYTSGRIRQMYDAGTTGGGNLINPSGDNPYFQTYEQLNTLERDRVYGNFSLDVSLIKNRLNLMLRSGMDYYTDFRTQRKPQYSVAVQEGNYLEQSVRNFEMNNDFLLSYKDTFGDFSVNASLGGNNMVSKYFNTIIKVDKLLEPNVFILQNSQGPLSVASSRNRKSINSFYGFVSLSWRDMLFVDVTGRNDWSSTLAPGNNSYFYPSVSMSVLLDEVFGLHEKAPWIDMLKLRGSWANVGNDTSPFQLLPVYANSSFKGGYKLSSSMQNYNIKPENIESWETGIEAHLFGNRWNFDVAYYSSATTDQIINVPTGYETGASSQLINAGKVTNRGVEISTRIVPLKNKNWNWTISLNWSKNWNKLVELAPGVNMWQLNTTNSIGGRVMIYAYPGTELGRIYGKGYARAPKGAYYFDDQGRKVDCGNRVIVDAKTGNPVLGDELIDLGSIYPDWRAGMTQTVRYRGVSLTMTFSGQWGGRAYSVSNFALSYMGKLKNTLPGRYDGLIHPGVNLGDDGRYTPNRTVTTDIVDYYTTYIWNRNNVEANTFDTSFLKMKECRIDYRLPARICRKLRVLQGIQIGVYATNLFCWTNWPQYDPEVAALGGNSLNKGVETGGYPMTRTYGFNLKLSF